MNITINGVEFQDIDFTEANTAAAFLDGQAAFQRVVSQKHEDAPAYIRDVCYAISDWADAIFGDGAGNQVFNGKMSLMLAVDVAGAIIKAYDESFNEFRRTAVKLTDEINDMRSREGNRQERRNFSKQKNRSNRPNAGSNGQRN